MERIALITDSTSGIQDKYLKKFNIHLVRLKVIYKDREFIDGLTITPKQVYDNLDVETPTTSMPSVADICCLYDELIENGYTHVIAVTISSGLSGTINGFRLAAEQYSDKITSFIYDSKSISMGSGLLVCEAGRMIEAGRDFEYICKMIDKIRKETSLYFYVDTLKYLIRGGRIGKVSGNIGEMIGLKPIITMDNSDGKYTTFTKVRGSKQAFNKLLSLGLEKINQCKCRVEIVTGTMDEEMKKLRSSLKSNSNIISIDESIMTPVVGVHSGPQLLGFVVYPAYEY